jgi:hypothetical protein
MLTWYLSRKRRQLIYQKSIAPNIPSSRHIQNRRRVCDIIPYWAGYSRNDWSRPIWCNTQIIQGTSSYLNSTLPVQRARRNICCCQTCLFYYRKAFDLTDHHLFVQKLNSFDIPPLGHKLGYWLSHKSISAREAFHGLSLWLGGSPFWSSPGNKIGTLALFTDDKRSQDPKRSHLEVRRRHISS